MSAPRSNGKRPNASGRKLRPLKWHRALEAWLRANKACAAERKDVLAWALTYSSPESAWRACRSLYWMQWASDRVPSRPGHSFYQRGCWCESPASIRKAVTAEMFAEALRS